MSFDFPSPASEGQFYTPLNGPQYVYVNGAWRMAGAPTAIVTAQTRNRIVNGAMQISQENGTTAGTTIQYYMADQWQLGFSSSSTISANRTIQSVSYPQAYFISVLATPAETAAAAGEFVIFKQIIEGIHTSDFGWGTIAVAKATVLAFDVNLPVAGTYWVGVQNASVTHSFLASYTVSAGEVATWVRKPVTVPAGAINAGTWAIGAAASATVHFCFHCGSTYTGVEGFQAGNLVAGPGQALGLSTAGRCYLSNVGLYLDPLATGIAPPWQMPDEAEELMACMRYYQQARSYMSGSVTSGGSYYCWYDWKVKPRATPAATGVNNSAVGFAATVGTLTPLNDGSGCVESRASNATSTSGVFSSVVTANARM
jgi:hypothetical protein